MARTEKPHEPSQSTVEVEDEKDLELTVKENKKILFECCGETMTKQEKEATVKKLMTVDGV